MKDKIKYSNFKFESILFFLLKYIIFFCIFELIYDAWTNNYPILKIIGYGAIGFFVLIAMDRLQYSFSDENSKLKISKKGIFLKRNSYKYQVKFEQIKEILMFEEYSTKNNCWLFIQEKTGKIRPIDLFYWNPNIQELKKTLTYLTNLHATKFSVSDNKNDVNNFLQQESKQIVLQKNEIIDERANEEVEEKAITIFSNRKLLNNYTFFKSSHTPSQESYNVDPLSLNWGIAFACGSGIMFIVFIFSIFSILQLTLIDILVSILWLLFGFCCLNLAHVFLKHPYVIVLTNESLSMNGVKYTWQDFNYLQATYDEKGIMSALVSVNNKRYTSVTNNQELAEQFTYFSRTFIDMVGKSRKPNKQNGQQ